MRYASLLVATVILLATWLSVPWSRATSGFALSGDTTGTYLAYLPQAFNAQVHPTSTPTLTPVVATETPTAGTTSTPVTPSATATRPVIGTPTATGTSAVTMTPSPTSTLTATPAQTSGPSPTCTPAAPGAPTNLSASDVEPTSYRAHWDYSGPAVAGFWIYQRNDEGDWPQIGAASESDRAFTVTGLSPGTTYYFHVAAHNLTGAAWSAVPGRADTPTAAGISRLLAAGGGGGIYTLWNRAVPPLALR